MVEKRIKFIFSEYNSCHSLTKPYVRVVQSASVFGIKSLSLELVRVRGGFSPLPLAAREVRAPAGHPSRPKQTRPKTGRVYA